ncbi:uncharacterized protein LOC109856162 [Pseudomyrmex gracilis]|uniref:uncharacterized protein LOC109856162 n=1 Tax=Pseudomyrmex gracilis TaxID=219809 RepID=UPI0009954D80|nr:uncharacterized protein LOC109856162 [Pseudomyrmex gracilis]XP_020286727.1 uncharacterized protein LOC109856162 [Pseudomyrmex gracilis]
METLFEPTPAKRKCTVIDINKMKNLRETVREFDLPKHFPSTMHQLRNEVYETQKNRCENIVSTSSASFAPQLIKVQKLRILSRNGRDLGEFNVQLRDDDPSKGKTIMLTKSPSKKDSSTVNTLPKPGKLYPRILRQRKNFAKMRKVDPPNVTVSLSKNISEIEKINSIKQQQSATLSKSSEFRNNIKNEKMRARSSDSDTEIDVETIPTNKTNSTGSTYKNINNNNKEYVLSNTESNMNTCLEIQDGRTVKDNKTFASVKPSYKNDINSISIANCKNLVVSLTNCMKNSENKITVNKGKCIANKNIEKDQVVESLKSKQSVIQGCNQDRKLSSSGSSLENKKSLEKSRITNETNMSRIKSLTQNSLLGNKMSLNKLRITNEKPMFQNQSVLSKQVHERKKQENIMTIIPNNETVLFNQPADILSNISVPSTSKKPTPVFLTKHIQESQIVNTTDSNMETSIRKKDLSQKDLSNKFDIIKKAMDSVKDSKLRELALKALADCGIGIERYVPIHPPEQCKAVHDSQVQTMVFGLLDPKSFVLINKDIKSLYRINQITLHDVPNVEPLDEQEGNFDIDSFVNEFVKNMENDSDILKINKTLSMSKLRCKSILGHLEKDFQSVKQYDQNGRLNIHNAVISNNIYLVKRHLLVLQQCKESVDIPTETGMTSLELAIKYDVCKEIVQVLLDAGAQPVVPIYLRESALIIASKQSSPLLPMLVKRVSNHKLLDQVDSEGYAALHYCSIYGNLQGVEALLSARATVDLQDKKSGRTPLFHALDNSHSSISRALLKAGAMAHITNYAGQTPIPIVPVIERESSPCKILSVT